jgi:hypothetical protein
LMVVGSEFEMLLLNLLLDLTLIFLVFRWWRVLGFAVIRFGVVLRVVVMKVVRFWAKVGVFLGKRVKIHGVGRQLDRSFVVGAHNLL